MQRKSPPSSELHLLVGTVKGIFIYRSDERREHWELTGPHLGGWEVFSLCGDARNRRILAGTGHFLHGPTIRSSRDGGKSWQPAREGPAFGAGSASKLQHIWLIAPGHPSEPGTWYAGTDDAALFVSRDDGESWSELKALSEHPTRPRWTPGFGGLCLHSFVVDPGNPRRLWVGISSVGVFRTEDGGGSWTLCNRGLHNVAPEFIKDPEMGRCVHRMVGDPVRSGVLFLQFHGGVFKSEDGADSWIRISAGLPHDFGFPMALTRRGDLFVVPLLSDQNRVVPDGALKVWRSRDGGRTWKAMTAGLPQAEHYVGVLRDALAADPLSPAGLYLGTTAGELFHSADDGEHWNRLPAQFPRITTVKAWLA